MLAGNFGISCALRLFGQFGLAAVLLGLTLLPPMSAFAAETTTYTYDALGRLRQVESAGDVNHGETTATSYDPAGNRIGQVVTGATVVNVSLEGDSAIEGQILSFGIYLSRPSGSPISLSYSVAAGTATAASDFDGPSGTVTFAPGETEEYIEIQTVDDSAVEESEDLAVNLAIISGNANLLVGSAAGTITDNDAPPELTVSDASVTEGGDLVFNVSLSRPSAGSVGFAISTSDGSATAGSDYDPPQYVGVILDYGITSADVTVHTLDDTITEGAETLTLTIASSSLNVVDGTAIGTINDNDAPAAQLAIGNASATEGGALSFTVTRSGNTAIAASASYATSGGTATSGSDFTAKSGTVSFAAGNTSKTITVSTTDDSAVESSESMTVTLSSPSSGATITTVTGTGTINDNDVAPANLAISNASVTEGGTLSFTVTRSGNTTIAASASYATSGGTATSGSDFTAKSGTVSFAAGNTSKTITVSTTDDSVVESAETMTVTLSSPSSGTTINTAVGTGTINDNDVVPVIFSTSTASANEGDPVYFVVTKSGNHTGTLSVSFATSNGTANALDYTATSGTLNFSPSEVQKTIEVQTRYTRNSEQPEYFYLTLSNPTGGATLGTSVAVGQINDLD